ncbi:hypothetical protein LTR47_002526 [Exophiala xenobiotica]|nr:hypothetical protein LTR92_003479 [Exophiala xenobiotica]KAK5236575.1 hypothetical protein LTR47_002526 [Exophiala xenobiotica]KAK5323360.1 hypothetical protein LTR93_005413 [Exophiala xenobiotica]KAK5338260.1 hypothetical protein LTR98_006109 [Exophiala xenobiotica]KAK5350685.1 hypothetical protein LTR61_005882 [Exophiala xenobiotica]
MCIKFRCCECNEAKYDYCQEYIDGRLWCDTNANSPCSEERDSCITCKTVCGAINRLNAMLEWEPWWATHGKGGEPEKPAWELEAFKEAEKENIYDSEGEDSDGYTKAERKKVRTKAQEAEAKRWEEALKQEQVKIKTEDRQRVNVNGGSVERLRKVMFIGKCIRPVTNDVTEYT